MFWQRGNSCTHSSPSQHMAEIPCGGGEEKSDDVTMNNGQYNAAFWQAAVDVGWSPSSCSETQHRTSVPPRAPSAERQT